MRARRRDAGRRHGFLHPPPQRDFVVHRDFHHAAGDDFDVVGRAQVADYFIGDAVGELAPFLARRVQPAKHADDGIDGLAAQGRQTVDQNDAASGTRRFHGRGNARRARSDHTDVAAPLEYRRLLFTGDDLRIGTERAI